MQMCILLYYSANKNDDDDDDDDAIAACFAYFGIFRTFQRSAHIAYFFRIHWHYKNARKHINTHTNTAFSYLFLFPEAITCDSEKVLRT